MSGVTGVILAGGLGTRLRSVVPQLPKVLVSVNGRPFITILLDQMESAGLERVVVCTGYLGDRVRQTLGDRYGQMRLAYSHEQEPLGTGGALRLARGVFDGGLALVVNGDSYAAADLRRFVDWHRSKPWSGSLLLCRTEDCARFGTVEFTADGQVRGFYEKRGRPGPGWINAGIYLLSQPLLETLPDGPSSLERDAFPAWIKSGLGAYCADAGFIDIGTPASLAAAGEFFIEQQRRAP
jgi:D-glycero-alpha-D-manno-heptose 1-phosphate guanylyltransferase